jgi:hypothetical protein
MRDKRGVERSQKWWDAKKRCNINGKMSLPRVGHSETGKERIADAARRREKKKCPGCDLMLAPPQMTRHVKKHWFSQMMDIKKSPHY